MYLKGKLAKGLKPEPDEILKAAAVNRNSRRRQSAGRFAFIGLFIPRWLDLKERFGSSALRKHGTHRKRLPGKQGNLSRPDYFRC
jgi:hypothetical protein